MYGKITTVEFEAEFRDYTSGALTINIPATEAWMTKLWTTNPTLELLSPLPNGDASIIQRRTRRMMFVPPKHDPLIMGNRLTPRELWSDIVGAIQLDNAVRKCRELVEWIMIAAFCASASAPSSVHQPAPVATPLVDAAHLRQCCALLHMQLPALRTRVPKFSNRTLERRNLRGIIP